MQPTAWCQRGRCQVSVGDGGRFFCTILSRFVSVAESKGLTERSVLVSAIVARMFVLGQGHQREAFVIIEDVLDHARPHHSPVLKQL